MVKLSKTRLWDAFSTVSYFLAFLLVLTLIIALAVFLMMTPELAGLA